MALIVTIVAALFTEICSNTAAAALLVPILAELTTRLCVNPLYLLLPVTLACSLAFMLPGTTMLLYYNTSCILASTPTNAVAYGSGKIKVSDLIKSGLVANIIGIGICNAILNTWGVFYFDLKGEDFKNWTDTRYC